MLLQLLLGTLLLLAASDSLGYPVHATHGLVNITGENREINYEIHGNGAKRACFVSGFRGSLHRWDPYLQHYANSSHEYSLLVIDNRGIGNSTNSKFEWSGYTTVGMARDIIAVLYHIGWAEENNNTNADSNLTNRTLVPTTEKFHLIGISLGGMIALEVAAIIPDSILTLTLLGSAARWHSRRSMGWGAGLFFREMVYSFPQMMFTPEWMSANDPKYPEFKSNLARYMYFYKTHHHDINLETIYEQFLAIGRHNTSADKLSKINAIVPKIWVIAGMGDSVIDPECSIILKDAMPNSELLLWKNRGHGLLDDSFNDIVAILDKNFLFQDTYQHVLNTEPENNQNPVTKLINPNYQGSRKPDLQRYHDLGTIPSHLLK